MMRYLINNYCKTLLLLAVISISFSCLKIDNELGNNIIPDKDRLIVVLDTLEGFEIQTLKIDSFQVDSFYTAYVGSMISPRLGLVNCGYITEVYSSVTEDAPNFKEDYVVDSVVLSLSFTNYLGNLNYNNKFEFYALAENFVEPQNIVEQDYFTDDMYTPFYSNFDYEKYLEDTPLITFEISALDAVNSSGENFEIELPESYYSVFNDLVPEDFEQDTTLRRKLKGYSLKALQTYGDGALLNIDPNNSFILVRAYDKALYEEDGEKEVIQLTFNFAHLVSDMTYNQMVNTVYNDPRYASSILGIPQSIINDTLNVYDYSYVGSMGSVKTRIKFPVDEIDELKNQLVDSPSAAIIVTSAILDLPVKDTTISALNYAPEYIAPYYNYDSSDYMPDYLFSDLLADATGAWLNRTKNMYSMDVTQYVQELLNKKTDHTTLDIATTIDQVIADKYVILDNSEDNRIKLRLTYCVAE